MNSSPEMHAVLIGGSAAQSWISWLLSVSSLLAGLMIANNKDIAPDTNFPVKFAPFLFNSLLGVLAATVGRNKKKIPREK